MNFRDLTADEIECRVQSVKENTDPKKSGLVLLLYKNARCDMNILDETVGAENWQREHYECKGNLFCRVGIWCNNAWVWKSDCGVESNTEAQKGEASDSFKRACFNWGIGRELYTAPFIWIPAEKCKIEKGKCYDKFDVKRITIRNKRIVELEIWNDSKKCHAWSMTEKGEQEHPKKQEQPAPIICADCGKVVDAPMAERTKKAFGVVLCKECGLKRSEKQ